MKHQTAANSNGTQQHPVTIKFVRGGREIVRYTASAPPRQLDITRLRNPQDLAYVIEYRLCEMLGMAGFSYKAIGKVVGLSRDQVGQRLSRLKVSVKSYRNGESPLAREVIARLDEVAQRKLVEHLERYLLK